MGPPLATVNPNQPSPLALSGQFDVHGVSLLSPESLLTHIANLFIPLWNVWGHQSLHLNVILTGGGVHPVSME